MKKRILSIALVVAMVAILAAGSFAYFVDTDSKDNTFTVGNVDIKLTEPKWDEVGSKDADTVYAGEPLAKDPTVTNDGANPCFVRVKVEGLNQFGDKGAITTRYNYANGYNETDWTYYNGYYYYNGVLAAEGGKTTPVFDQIVMPTGLKGGEEAAPVVVSAEAVQAQGAMARWADVQNMSVEQIAAWFTTCGM